MAKRNYLRAWAGDSRALSQVVWIPPQMSAWTQVCQVCGKTFEVAKPTSDSRCVGCQLQAAWDTLQSVPAYVERDLSDE